MGGLFEVDKKIIRIKELEEELLDKDIWSNSNKVNLINSELSNLKKTIEEYQNIKEKMDTIEELLTIIDDDIKLEIEKELDIISKTLEDLRIKTLLNGEYDNLSCFLEIHSGAGGTEACDWVSMLLRMYERFCDKNNYKYEVMDYLKGDEAGYKSVILRISGFMAYGYFKGEKGVHRLVRISPFDANKRRHTSFASVTVIPEFEKQDSISIKDEDLKIDVFHSSGAGGQSVNTSDSAVRITHIPTNIVVTCQVERSQLRNKERAMKMLEAKLYNLEIEKREEELNKEKGISSSINFGSQIRNYVLEPYKLVKDLRTNYETSESDKVLDGDILPFLEKDIEYFHNN